MNLFSKKISVKPEITNQKSSKELIQEIHSSFNNEVDVLIEESKKINETKLDNDLIKKSERLSKLGFVLTEDVINAYEEVEKLERQKKQNQEKKDLLEAIEYFRLKYPLYNFITEKSVRKICKKYNLIYGCVNIYQGKIPEKNLLDIEKAKIDITDECYVFNEWHSSGNGSINQEFVNLKELPKKDEKYLKTHNVITNHEISRAASDGIFYHKALLEIVAPQKDFKMYGYKVKDSKIVPEDPIVLKPICYKNKKHYLILTAWGDEASDEKVVNPINN